MNKKNLPMRKSVFPVAFDLFDNDFLGTTQFKVDIKETKDTYEVTADMPGCSKKDTNVEYHNDQLIISANHESHKEDVNEAEHFIRKEREQTSYRRSFYLPDADKIKGKFKDGVLTITLPKLKETEVAKKKIELE